jgi:ribosomal protein S18 acetylase RimI-like enzyme
MQEEIVFRAAQPEDKPVLSQMIKALYECLVPGEEYMTDEKINATFDHLFSPQQQLRLEVFETDQKIIGYALLVDYWYNEYGGMVLQLDELYIAPEARGRGIASSYIRKISQDKTYVAIHLEVLPENENAYKLYKHLGFEEKETKLLYRAQK